MTIILTLALLAIAGVLLKLVRQINELSGKIDFVAQEQATQHSIDRRYIGLDLIEGRVIPMLEARSKGQNVGCGTFGAQR